MNSNPHIQDITRENELIVLCSRTRMSDEIRVRIEELLSGSLEWEKLLNTAGRNGLLPIVCWTLLNQFVDRLDPELKERLSNFFREHLQRNMYLTKKLIEIVDLFEENGIPSLPFKGTTLAMRAYGHIGLREYCDLDILVQPKHFDQAAALLATKGYIQVTSASWLERKFSFLTRRKDIIMVSPDREVVVELHWKLSGSHFALPLEIDRLWNAPKQFDMGGRKINVLDFKNLFVYLSLHGARHRWIKFAWVVDLNELILAFEEGGETVDWKGVMKHAAAYGCERVVEFGLFLVNRFYGYRPDYSGLEKIIKNEEYRSFADQLMKQAFAEKKTPVRFDERYQYYMSLKGRKSHRLKLQAEFVSWYFRILFRPNSLDRSIFHLPRLLYPLYFVLRPVRLFLTYYGQDAENTAKPD